MKYFKQKIIFILLLGVFIMAPLYFCRAQEEIGFNQKLEEEKKESFEELSIRLKALQTAAQVGEYLKNNPDLTIEKLQKDLVFKKIAVQLVGETGYTAVNDANSGYIYFHPQEQLVNTDSHALKEKLPDFWDIFSRTIGEECEESFGVYKWTEEDGSVTEKYMHLACVNETTADGKNLFIAATTYLDEMDALKYLEKYEIKKNFSYAKDAIKQKAEDVAKQIEIYLKLNPDKTVKDLQTDQYFQEIAVQGVGETGYTCVYEAGTGIMRIHPNSTLIDKDMSFLKDELPDWWKIFEISLKGEKISGKYAWLEKDGAIRDKYMTMAPVGVSLGNVTLMVAATAYLDEYEKFKDSAVNEKDFLKIALQPENEEEDDLAIVIYWLFGGLAVIFLVLLILKRLSLIRIEKSIAMGLLAGSLFLIIGLFVISTYQITQNLKNDKLRFVKDSLNAIAESQANHIRHLLRTHKDKINFINMNKGFIDLLEMPDNNPIYKNLYSKVRDRLNGSLHEEFDEIFILDKNGQVIISTNKGKIGQDRSDNAYFINTKEKIYIKDAYKSETTNENSMAVSVPIINESVNEFLGVLVARIKMDNLNETILNKSDITGTAESYLVNKDRLAITSLKYEENAFLKTEINEINVEHCFQDEHGQEEHAAHKEAMVSQNYKGVDVIGAHVYIPEMQWCLLVERDEKEVMADINKDVSRIWYFTFGIISLIILIGAAFNFLLTGSLKKEIEAKTVDIKNKSNKIEEQLRKEEETTKVKEWLLREQKKAKKELEKKINELEKFQKLTVGRELKMIELKEKIKELEKNSKF